MTDEQPSAPPNAQEVATEPVDRRNAIRRQCGPAPDHPRVVVKDALHRLRTILRAANAKNATVKERLDHESNQIEAARIILSYTFPQLKAAGAVHGDLSELLKMLGEDPGSIKAQVKQLDQRLNFGGALTREAEKALAVARPAAPGVPNAPVALGRAALRGARSRGRAGAVSPEDHREPEHTQELSPGSVGAGGAPAGPAPAPAVPSAPSEAPPAAAEGSAGIPPAAPGGPDGADPFDSQ